jgi:hypothetical protein
MQSAYSYVLSASAGEGFAANFKPKLTPKQMLALGVFGGKYMNDCTQEFPADWFVDAKLSVAQNNIDLNYYAVDASQSRSEWIKKRWIHHQNSRG